MKETAASNYQELAQSLKELAMDLHWSWNHATDKIWRQLDPVLWELTHNPPVVLQTVSSDRINEVLSDPIVKEIVEELIEIKKQRSIAPAWFQKSYPNTGLSNIAFFSMEFMLSEALPIYSGGLGNVAGDLLKTASDLGVPVVGVGLMYQQGYPRQIIHKDGTQQYVAPYNDPGQLPITPLRHANGEWLRIEIKFPGYSVWLRTWKVQVGRVSLLLLDSNDAANFPTHRGITNELYGGDSEMRLMQELILGIGGWRLLRALGLNAEVCHLNEGHSAFVIAERALVFMQENNVPFEVALNVTRAGNIFTTHTAVGAGADLFTAKLIEQFLGKYITQSLHISVHDFLALGRKNANDETEPFNTGFFAIRGSGHVNAVSKLHGEVSRQLFANLFPRWPIAEVPIGHVTNGVHMPSWDSPEADKLWTETCGKDRWLRPMETMERDICCVPDHRLWSLCMGSKKVFIDYIRRRYARQLATIGESANSIADVQQLFDPEIFTLGFARRFAGYKRPILLLQNPERLRRILLNKDKPVQLFLAGKAHPADVAGQAMIKKWIQFIDSLEIKGKVIFLSDYDMLLTEQLVQGIDLWINTPRRPWEACGTSGMKVLVNGGINLSELDGWWDEAYRPDAGWVIGDRNDHKNDSHYDAVEAEQLYNLLENEIIPEYYDRNQDGIPERWVNRMRVSMAKLTPQYSSTRSLQEYTVNYYLPALNAFQIRAANKAEYGKQLTEWKICFEKKWEQLRFTDLKIETKDGEHHFHAYVYLNHMNPEEISVELYANEESNKPLIQKMKMLPASLPGSEIAVFSTSVPSDRPQVDYTPRIIAKHDRLFIPLECTRIIWYR